MRIAVATAIAGMLSFASFAQANHADAHPRHAMHRHRPAAIAPYRRPYAEVPPGYSFGGPSYTTCDRINRDRMLVGTCR